ncbi:MAG: hypothetical protein JJ892_12245 [Balneola sp.]|nr:hypothetical protein [Balneola sp.]MBO6652062.1 hypothetical protein [Balneola sp.]MBO6712467.1 hypothetical protein [Balneola sp.]MBO6801040.1 hypothetical protein [Balneola sp.]MBO6870712.1 hypothetical protein [Balneola sp.]
MASQERNEIDGSEGAIITLWLICEYASYAGRPFVMISRCNGVRVNNSCRELLVLEPVLRKLSIGTKVHSPKKLLRSREGSVPTQSIGTRLNRNIYSG